MRINRRQFNYGFVVGLGSLSLSGFSFQPSLRVNGKRIMDHIFALAEFGKNPQGGVSRFAYSDADKQGREYVLGLMREAKLDVSIDAAGNLIRKAGVMGIVLSDGEVQANDPIRVELPSGPSKALEPV